jgi:hypothetical protein
MACNAEIHLGDIGTAFRISLTDCDVPVDLTGATNLHITFKKPDKTSNMKTASIYGDPLNGVIQYITVDENDLDQLGTWEIQAVVELPTGRWSSNIDKFRVYENL